MIAPSMRWNVDAEIRIEAPRAEVYGVVSSVEHLPSWVSALAGGRVLAAEGDVRIVEVSRLGEGRLVVEVVESAPRSLRFTQVDRDRSRGISGEVELEEAQGATVVRARLTVPASLWRLGVRWRIRRELGDALEALEKRCGHDTRQPGSRPLLSIRRRKDGSLELWLEGMLYDLVPRRSARQERGPSP